VLPEPVLLPLGISPRRLTGLALAEGWAQLLWLDQTLPGEVQLIGGTLNAGGMVERGPTEISLTRTADYVALPAPGGAVVVLWTTPVPGDPSGQPTLHMQLIDSTGRPLPGTRLAASGSFPAATFDLHGNLHLLWLSRLNAQEWAIHTATLDRRLDLAREVPSEVASAIVGAISLSAGQALESFVVAADSASLYAMWSVRTAEGRGGVSGITFPVGQPTAVRTLLMSLSGSVLRWPTFPNVPGEVQYLAVTARHALEGQPPADQQADQLLVFEMSPGAVRPLTVVTTGRRIVSRPTLARDVASKLHLAWVELERDGRASLYYATNALP
jgi:hypothetical protein